MRGVTVLTDEKKRTKIVQADIKLVAKKPDEFERFIFILAKEYRQAKAVKKKDNKNADQPAGSFGRTEPRTERRNISPIGDMSSTTKNPKTT
ncbi:MAG: hypothetical protein ABL876_06230 [Chitinophagaceae bacterium]